MGIIHALTTRRKISGRMVPARMVKRPITFLNVHTKRKGPFLAAVSLPKATDASGRESVDLRLGAQICSSEQTLEPAEALIPGTKISTESSSRIILRRRVAQCTRVTGLSAISLSINLVL